MSKIDLNNYETVKERKKRFYKDHPDGRIIVELWSQERIEDLALFKASVFTDIKSYLDGAPKATGFALELRDKELSRNSRGGTYESVNYSSWTENCEESAIGRALDNAGYSVNDKCSREEMEKAERMKKSLSQTIESPNAQVGTAITAGAVLALGADGWVAMADEPEQPPTPDDLNQVFGEAPAPEVVFKTQSDNPAGDFVIKFGKHKGKALKQIPDDELIGYAEFLSGQEQKSSNAVELIKKVGEWLGVQ